MTLQLDSPRKRVPLLLKPVWNLQSLDCSSLAVPQIQQSVPFEEQKGEEAATPGQPAALSRVLDVSPRQLSRELPAATGSAAINRRAQERSRFAVATFLHMLPRGNPKKARFCEEPVDGRSALWKHEEN